ncbi:hypothetical protein OESDEN_05716 [Oesophagostomum dentatum]|uniref:Uncharacterized protein n=1 Tax=Oesophagostomum dentatum TaxID=61180 RepID=A0A0B1TG21_OESDE|nr:hypothetical protein OESDEN_05716 [Oesophagostomum dentatum]
MNVDLVGNLMQLPVKRTNLSLSGFTIPQSTVSLSRQDHARAPPVLQILAGPASDAGSVNQSQVRTALYDNRLDSLRILRKHPLENMTAAVSCMDIDRVENSFLLCGGISGAIYLSNLLMSDQFGAKREKFTLPSSLYWSPAFRNQLPMVS